MTVHKMPTEGARDPRTSPRVGDQFRVGRNIRTVLGWWGPSHSTNTWFEPPKDGSDGVVYATPRSRGVMSWTAWLEWAKGADVLHEGQDPRTELSWEDRTAGAERVEWDAHYPHRMKTAWFSWGYAVFDFDACSMVLYDHEDRELFTFTGGRHRFSSVEATIAAKAYQVGCGRNLPGQPIVGPPALCLIEGGADGA